MNFDGKKPPYAIVIGLDSLPGIQTARILAQRGVPVIGIAANRKHAFCRTNVCKRILIADTSKAECVEVLRELALELEQKAVLVPCDDHSVLLVSRNRTVLSDYHVMLPPAEVVEMLIDKVEFYEFAVQHDLPIPPTFILRTRQDAKAASEKLDYPAVLKPPHRTEGWVQFTAAKAFRVSNPDELLRLYDNARQHVDTLIAQKWIAGTDENLFSCNCYYASNGNPLVSFTARKIRQWPPEIGISSLGVECRNDEVVRLTHLLFQSVPYRGLAYLEVKLDSLDGEHYIVEPNIGRPTGRSAISEAGGVELLYTMYRDALGLPLPENRQQQFRGVKWIFLRHDFQSAVYYWLQGELSFRAWLRSLRGPKTFAIFSWRDPLPFVFDCLHTLRRALSSEGRKSRDYRPPSRQI